MLRILTAGLAAALLAAGAAVAQDDDFVELDRVELADGSAEVSVSKSLRGREAEFAISVSRTRTDGDVVSDSGGESIMPMRAAGAKRHARLRVARTLCGEPVGVVGTVTRRVARVELVAGDGTVTRLRRHRPPSGWRFGGTWWARCALMRRPCAWSAPGCAAARSSRA